MYCAGVRGQDREQVTEPAEQQRVCSVRAVDSGEKERQGERGKGWVNGERGREGEEAGRERQGEWVNGEYV